MTNKNNFKILIIDDNTSIHQDFMKILKPTKQSDDFTDLESQFFGEETKATPNIVLPEFVIDTATQGLEGIKKVKEAVEAGNPYSLAFVDIRMPPGLDGIQTIKQIWEFAPELEIVICTAFSDYGWEETVEQLGIHDNLLILKKPFDSIAVRQLACSLTKKWQLMQAINDHTKNLEKKVSERTESLQQSLSLTRATLDSSIDGVIAINNQGQVVDFNNRYLEMWNIDAEKIKGKNYEECLGLMRQEAVNSDDLPTQLDNTTPQLEVGSIHTVQLKDGRVFEKYWHPQTLDGDVIGKILSFRDITNRVQLEGQLEYQATHDALTGLANRLLLTSRAEQALQTARRYNSKMAILFFDLDRFKYINDSLGHEVGDDLLKSVANNLKAICREEDIVSRLGGDEFVMVINNIKSENDVINVAEKVMKMFGQPFRLGHREMYITSSIGISIFPDDAASVDELMKCADLAMYNSKNSGSNKYSFYSPEFSEQANMALETENELRQALINNEFFLVYQPQCDISSKQCTSVEALIRWNHPTKGIVPPNEFIPFAEDSGLIVPIGEWVMRTACSQCKKWQDMGIKDLRMGINIATAQLRQEGLVDMVKQILTETNLKPECLEIEIVENVIYSDETTRETINKLKEIGVQIALDDFGSGHSSLSHLKLINVDRVKIDQSFIQNINIDRSDEVIIQAIIDMAKSLGFSVTAEGVETALQQEFVEAHDCDSIQGFHFGKPMIAGELTDYLVDSYNIKKEKTGSD